MSIFLPAAGFCDLDALRAAGYGGDYWSSLLYTDNPNYAWYMRFYAGNVSRAYGSRYYGRSVRPVL